MAQEQKQTAKTKETKQQVRLDRRLKAEHIRRLVERIANQGGKAGS